MLSQAFQFLKLNRSENIKTYVRGNLLFLLGLFNHVNIQVPFLRSVVHGNVDTGCGQLNTYLSSKRLSKKQKNQHLHARISKGDLPIRKDAHKSNVPGVQQCSVFCGIHADPNKLLTIISSNWKICFKSKIHDFPIFFTEV